MFIMRITFWCFYIAVRSLVCHTKLMKINLNVFILFVLYFITIANVTDAFCEKYSLIKTDLANITFNKIKKYGIHNIV